MNPRDLDFTKFRIDYPEFSDVGRYTDSMLEHWSFLGKDFISFRRWKHVYQKGLQLFVAHFLALQERDKLTAKVGGIPGGSAGVVSSKQARFVSANYETQSTMESPAGHWNQTSYGRIYIHMARLIGAGAVQL